MHGDVRTVECVAQRIVGGEAAGARDLVHGVGVVLVVQVHDERSGVAHDPSVCERHELPIRKCRQLELVLALGVDELGRVIRVGSFVAGDDSRDIFRRQRRTVIRDDLVTFLLQKRCVRFRR